MDKTTYKRAFDAISAPDTAMNDVFTRIAPRPRRTIPRMALALCALLILTCTAAVASGIGGGWLGSLINLNGGEVPSGNLQVINQTIEQAGLRLTLQEAASDGVHIYLLMDIESLDGQDFSHAESDAIPLSDSIWVDGYLLLNENGGYGMNVFRLDDGSDPARAQLAFRFGSSESFAGQQMELVVSALEHSMMIPHGDAMLRTSEPIAEGEWRFAFRLNDHLETVRYTLDSFDVSVSALGISIEGAGCGVLWPDPLTDSSMSLKMTDSTTSELTSAGYHALRSDGKVTAESIDAATTELIKPGDAAAIIINEVEYPLIPVR